MKNLTKSLMLVVLLVVCVSAQYLEVRRSATVKEQSNASSSTIEKVKKGEYLRLLDGGQQENGYYKVRANSVNRDGYIYRTFVRRHQGEMPGSAAAFDPPPTGYYGGTQNLKGAALKSALHGIIQGHTEFAYANVWALLKETDVDPNDNTKVVGIYSGFSMMASDQDDDGQGWNREHVWAKSFGDFGTRKGAGTDLHHLRAEDYSTNSARNNRSFDEGGDQYIDKSGTYQGATSCRSSTRWTWEPRDEVKGDVARMLFYMAVRYEGGGDEPDLELADRIIDKDSKEPHHGKVSVLLKWHKQDPVDNRERRRNSVVFKHQKNRNPFIDHPEFVGRVWEN